MIQEVDDESYAVLMVKGENDGPYYDAALLDDVALSVLHDDMSTALGFFSNSSKLLR